MAINPLQPPVNYLGMIPHLDLAKQFEGFGEALAERQKRTQAEEIKATYKTDLQAVLNNPSMKAFNEFVLKYPQQREVIKDVADRFTTEQKDAEFNIGRDIAVALENNEPNVALNLLTQTVDARKTSNLPPSIYGQVQKILSNTDDPDRINKAKFQTNFALNLLNPEKMGKVIENLEKQTLAPSALQKSVADADKAVADKEKAVLEAKDTPARLQAEQDLRVAQAKKVKIEADFEEKKQKDEINKRLADLNLTKAQINKYRVETANLNTTGALLKLDFDAAVKGLPLPSGKGGTVGTATEDERKAAGWLVQADNAYKNMLNAMYTKEGKKTGAQEPGFFEAVGLGKVSQSPERQKFNQASASLAEALLRAATGAGQNEAEVIQKIEELTPTFFDTQDNINQKLAAIPVYLDSLKARAGRAAPAGYVTPTKESVIAAKPFSVTVGGKAFNFPTQQALDVFMNSDLYKKAAGNK